MCWRSVIRWHRRRSTLIHPAVEPKLDLAPNVARKRKIDVALSNSFGFGGTNASLVIGKVRG